MTVLVIALVVAVLVVLGVVAAMGRRRPPDGVTAFRRHIDALSPEARREVIDRVQHARESGKGK
jgi:hypothetical protein